MSLYLGINDIGVSPHLLCLDQGAEVIETQLLDGLGVTIEIINRQCYGSVNGGP